MDFDGEVQCTAAPKLDLGVDRLSVRSPFVWIVADGSSLPSKGKATLA
jgi:hypothetical protein